MTPLTPKHPAPDLTSPPPAWTVLTPSDRLTVVTSLPLEEVQHLLASRLAGGLTRGGSGIFSSRRTYEGRLDGDTLTLRGPFGNRKWTLLTRGLLVATPTGTALHLAMRLDQGYAIVLGFFGLIFFGFAFSMACRNPIMLPFVFLQLAFLYGGVLIGIKVEAGYIRELLAEIVGGKPC
jgi:hypothetical protein